MFQEGHFPECPGSVSTRESGLPVCFGSGYGVSIDAPGLWERLHSPADTNLPLAPGPTWESLFAIPRIGGRGPFPARGSFGGNLMHDQEGTEAPFGELTPRELDVIRLMAGGVTNSAIGEELGIGLETAKTHVGRIIAKTGAASREEAVAVWREWNRPRARWGRRARSLVGGAAVWKMTAAAGGAILLVAAVGALALWQRDKGSTEATEGYEGWAESYSEYLVELITPGSEYRVVTEHYDRHGPAAPLIRESDSYLPERRVLTQWFVFDASGSAVDMGSEMADSRGRVFQTSALANAGEILTVNTLHGTSETAPWPGPIDVSALRESAQRSHRALLARVTAPDADVTVSDDGPGTLITFPQQTRVNEGSPDGYSVPFIRDLNPVSTYRTVELDKVTHAVVAERTYVVDAAGVETMVESTVFAASAGPKPGAGVTPTALDDYSDQLWLVDAEFDDAVDQALASWEALLFASDVTEEDALLGFRSWYAGHAGAFRQAIEGYGSLAPPDSAGAVHDEFVTALEGVSLWLDLVSAEVGGADTNEELEAAIDVVDAAEVGPLIGRLEDACLALQAEAANSFLNLSCGLGSERLEALAQFASFDPIDIYSTDGERLLLSVTLDYSVSPTDLARLLQSVGPNWLARLVETRVSNFFKEAVAEFTAVEVTSSLDVIRARVLGRLAADLMPGSIRVQGLLIDDVARGDD